LCKPQKGEKVSLYDLGAVRARNKNKAHSQCLELFEKSGLTKADLAKMLGKKPEQITRWLAGPGNITLDTLSDLVFALSGEFFVLEFRDDLARAKSNRCSPDWLQPPAIEDGSHWESVTVSSSNSGYLKTSEAKTGNTPKLAITVMPPKSNQNERFRKT
jgi:plasmid maintenance system antidote protein VapI